MLRALAISHLLMPVAPTLARSQILTCEKSLGKVKEMSRGERRKVINDVFPLGITTTLA